MAGYTQPSSGTALSTTGDRPPSPHV